MKSRVTLTLDPRVLRRAKNLAHRRKMSFSGLVEDLLSASGAAESSKSGSFVEKWAGVLKLDRDKTREPLFQALKAKHGL